MNSEDTLAVIRTGALGTSALRSMMEPVAPVWERTREPASVRRDLERKLFHPGRGWRLSEDYQIVNISIEILTQERRLDELIASVKDASLSLEERGEALNLLFERQYDDLPALVIDELERTPADPWQRVLMMAVEYIQPIDAILRERLLRFLIAYARDHVQTRDPTTEASLAAALRRYSAMVPSSEIDTFLPFLDAAAPPRTKSLAAACIENVFSASAPQHVESSAVRDRLLELVRTYANPELVSSAENAAIAINALAAIAAAFPADLLGVADLVRALAKRPFFRLALQRIRRVRSNWGANGGTSAARSLDQGIEALEREA